MTFEIERKFLVNVDNVPFITANKVERITQAYLSTDPDKVIRVRVVDYPNEKAYLTVKGSQVGITRREIETEIDVAAAWNLINYFCGGLKIEKTRYTIPIGNNRWEVDCFTSKHQGLIIAEIELEHERQDIGELPTWITKEVTHDARYTNASLAQCPWPFEFDLNIHDTKN